jgi:oligopeptide transport system substrate-binding protein
MRGAKSAKWVVGAVVVALAATACGGSDGDSKDKGSAAAGGTFRMGSTEPDTIDPGRAHESTGILLANALFTGLYGNTPDGLAEPALAESATSDEGCTSWTFKIKPDTKFSNGEVVNAESFARGWARAAHKAAASDVAYHFAGIKGYEQLQDGSAKTFSGVTTPDANTLKVDLSKADCEFVLKTAHNAYSPVPSTAKVGEEDKAFGEAPSVTVRSRWTARGSTTRRSTWSATTVTVCRRPPSRRSRSRCSTTRPRTSSSTTASRPAPSTTRTSPCRC